MGRLALVLGAAAGLALVAYSLVPPILAGERVPPTSFAVAGLMIATMALLPYAMVRWRWRKLRATLEED
jgi:drug/metabolite transporter (DMT)-like permease